MVKKRLSAFAALLAVTLSGCATSEPSSSGMPAQNIDTAATHAEQIATDEQAVATAATSATSIEPENNPGKQSTTTVTSINESIKTIPAKVIEAVDGDTIKVSLNGKAEMIRFLLVDTPETHHPRLGVQPFGKDAAAFTKSIVEGKTVQLEQDVNNGPDKYGRLLFYVYVDGKSVQEQLLEKGLARVAYIYVPNVKYVDKYREIQKKAQQQGVGIWSIENYAQENGYHAEVANKNASTFPSDGKSAVNSPAAPRVTPVQSHLKTPEQIKQEVHQQYDFNNCAAARAAGAAPLYRGQPGYKEKLDGDHDGIACE